MARHRYYKQIAASAEWIVGKTRHLRWAVKDAFNGFHYRYPLCCIMTYFLRVYFRDWSIGSGYLWCGYLRCPLHTLAASGPLRMTCCSYNYGGRHSCNGVNGGIYHVDTELRT